jgi:hypothetical protein
MGRANVLAAATIPAPVRKERRLVVKRSVLLLIESPQLLDDVEKGCREWTVAKGTVAKPDLDIAVGEGA